MEYSTIDNEKLTYFMNKIYNQWFVKWRDKAQTMTKEDWETLIVEGVEIGNEGEQYSIVMQLIKVFLAELEERYGQAGGK